MGLWSLLGGLLDSKKAIDAEVMRKRSSRTGYPLNAAQLAQLDELIRAGKRLEAIAAHREMSGSGPDGASNEVDRRASELGVRLG